MRVKMKVEVSGTRNGVPWPARGGEVDLPDVEAMEYCAAGMADPVAVAPKVEKAVAPEAEKRGKARG